MSAPKKLVCVGDVDRILPSFDRWEGGRTAYRKSEENKCIGNSQKIMEQVRGTLIAMK